MLYYLFYVIIFFIVRISFGSLIVNSDTIKALSPFQPNVIGQSNTTINEGLFYISRTLEPVLSIKTFGFEIPILFQDRHTTLTIWPFKLLSDLFGSPEYSLAIWHFLLGLLSVYLFKKYLELKRIDPIKKSIAMILMIINPLFICGYLYFISEPLVLVIFLMSLCYLEKNRIVINQNNKLRNLAILLSLGFIARVNFIWLAFSQIIPVVKKLKKRTFVLMSWGFVFSLPYLLMINYSRLFSNQYSVKGNFKTLYINVTHFFSLIFSGVKGFSFLYDENFYHSMFQNGYFYFLNDPYLWGTVGIFISLLYKCPNKKEVASHFLQAILFLGLMILSVGNRPNFVIYIFPLWIWSVLIFIEVINTQDKFFKIPMSKLSVIFLIFIGASSVRTYGLYISKGVVSIHDASIYKEAIEKNEKKEFSTLGVSDAGKYEFLSSGQLRPRHLYKLISKGNYISFLDLLDKLGKGRIITPVTDEWSYWHAKWGEIDPRTEKRKAAAFGIDIINDEVIYRHGEPKLWMFDFKKRRNVKDN